MHTAFYARDTATVARELLGCNLVREMEEDELRGRIVETEAYYGEDDPASHACNGKTERNAVMFGPPGQSYVYVCYGIHHMLNVVTEDPGTPGAVLIRAAEPVAGLEQMQDNRGVHDVAALCNGPGKLCQAFNVTQTHHDTDLTAGSLRIEPGEQPEQIRTTPRIGISRGAEKALRFYINGNEHVSSP